jgi:hypothetical protein
MNGTFFAPFAFPYGAGKDAMMMRMIFTTAAAGLVWAACVAPGLAQMGGPPIPPDQVLRSQPMPQTTVPPPQTVPSPSPGNNGGLAPIAPAGRGSGSSDRRVRDCQQQAAEDRVPTGKRGSYVHTCMQGD